MGRYHPIPGTKSIQQCGFVYFIIYLKKKKIFIDMKFKFQIRNIMYYKKAIKYFFQIYKSYLFLFICAWHCKSCGTLLTNHHRLMF